MKKNLLAFILIISAISAAASAQEPGITYLDEPYANINLAFDQAACPPVPIPLENITDSLSDYMVGHTAIHQVGFQLPHFEGSPTGLLRGRQVVVTFPPEFNVRTITSVSYFDTDDADDPRIDWIFVYAHSLVVRFKDKLPGPSYPHFAYLTIRSLDNPTVADDFQVIVQVDNLLMQTIAGPGFSERFSIISGQVQSLTISPSQDTTLRAGEGIAFEATAVDQYGNPIETGRVEWSLDPDLDSIGRFYGSFFQATTTGEGRVVARVDNLEARSGLITVLPGEIASLKIELDETQFVGVPFIGENSYVLVYDEFGNLVTDFNQSGLQLSVSVDGGSISPDVLPSEQFVNGIGVLYGYVYSGNPGRATLRVTDGGDIEGTKDFYANGLYAEFDDGYHLPEWLLKDWSFNVRGGLWNPANLAPISVEIEAGFLSGDASPARILPLRYCTPAPFGAAGCRFGIDQLADMTPGIYDFKIIIRAAYELPSGMDTVTTEWTYTQTIPVDDFVPFSYEAVDLPATGYAGEYTDSGQIKLSNDNTIDGSITMATGLDIKSNEIERVIGSSSFIYDWEPEKLIDLELQFYPELQPGLYDYAVRTKAYYYSSDNSWRIGYYSETPLDAQIEITAPAEKAIRLVSVDNGAVNAPYVNTGQQFMIHAVLSNLTDYTLPGPFTLELNGDGQSITPPPLVLDYIPPTDTPFVVNFPVMAGDQSNPAEVFTLHITGAPDGIRILPPIDNYAVAVIQTPASVNLAAEILYHPGPVSILGYGQPFEIKGSYINSGQAAIDGGTLILDYSGPGDFGLDFPSEKELDTVVSWPLTAPDEAITSSFNVALGAAPVDRNTGQPAIVSDTSITLDFKVIPANTRLIMEAEGFSTRPLERGLPGKLFQLTMQNTTSDYRNTVALERIRIQMIDRDGRNINPGDILDSLSSANTNFFLNGIRVGSPSCNFDGVYYNFSDIIIRAGEVINLEYFLQPRADAKLDYFNIRLDGSMINAVISEGPQAGQSVAVVGLLDRAFEINLPQSIIPEEFAASFKNYPNPFNPMQESTEIRYNLPYDSDVDIHIYTATGEEVRHLHFDAGANGGRAGLNADIYWDGQNGHGDMVLNGIYIAHIEAATSGLTATVKMAVVK